jgi:hypothetical protein
MNINKTRSFLYSLARLLGDFNAIKKGRVKERIFNKIIGKLLSKLFR